MLRKEGNNKSIGIKVFSLKMRRIICMFGGFVCVLFVKTKFSCGKMVAIYFLQSMLFMYIPYIPVNVTA